MHPSRLGGFVAIAALASGCAEAPKPRPEVAPAVVTSAPAPAAVTTSSAAAPPTAPAEPAPPCEQVAHAPVAGRDVSLCLRHDDAHDDDGPGISMSIEDAAGHVLLEPGFLMSFLRKFGEAPKVAFGDATGDGVDDVLVSAPAAGSVAPLPCRYVVDGAALLRSPTGDEREGDALSLGHSLAASLAPGSARWAPAEAAKTTITPKEACAVVAASRTLAGFRKHATADAEIVDYTEPSRPYCSRRVAGRGVTRERVAELEEAPCSAMTCAKGIAVCRNHEPDPSAQYYLFERAKDGRLRLRGVALYRGS